MNATRFLLLLLLFAAPLLRAQKGAINVIRLENAGFEDEPSDATVPAGWHPCAEGTTPDILPGPWGVYNEPSEGDTFMGLITRQDGSFESVGQRFSTPLLKNECYRFRVDLAHSKTYTGYNRPLKLRIYGAETRCDKLELIGKTGFIEHTDFRTYDFSVVPKTNLNYIVIEAYYRADAFSHMGNILIDNISVIQRCPRA